MDVVGRWEAKQWEVAREEFRWYWVYGQYGICEEMAQNNKSI